jgi:GNAT superfamily N-acetyltransferase
MEKLAYLLKRQMPGVFQVVEAAARRAVALRFGPRLTRAEREATIVGAVGGRVGQIRPLRPADGGALSQFLDDLPSDYLRYFRPHPFDGPGLERVLRSRAFLNYGIFVEGSLAAYALLKIAPTGSAFIGLLVHPDYGRLGLGKFIVAYLYWQASLAGLRTRSTISRHNPASLRSHEAVSEFEIVAELPNDYIMIEFPRVEREKPELNLPGRGERDKAKGEKKNG